MRYGVSGNGFVCELEFGKTVKAKSLLLGGNSGHPASPHFTNQQPSTRRGSLKTCGFTRPMCCNTWSGSTSRGIGGVETVTRKGNY